MTNRSVGRSVRRRRRRQRVIEVQVLEFWKTGLRQKIGLRKRIYDEHIDIGFRNRELDKSEAEQRGSSRSLASLSVCLSAWIIIMLPDRQRGSPTFSVYGASPEQRVLRVRPRGVCVLASE